jgi:polar amino acid transport system substrate-binding protein
MIARCMMAFLLLYSNGFGIVNGAARSGSAARKGSQPGVTMRRLRFLLVGTAFVAGVCCARLTAAADTPPATGAATELRVGIAAIYPPLAFKQDGELTGIEVQFAQQLGTDLGVKITFVETPFPELIPALRAQRIDIIMSGMSITDDRKKLVSFTQPYLRVGQMRLMRREDVERLKSRAAMNRPTTRIGVVTGTTGETYVRAHLGRATIEGFADVDAAVAALRADRIDVFIHDAPSIWRIVGGFESTEHQLQGEYEPLTEEYLAWAVRKNDHLRDRLNTVLHTWRGNGELEHVLDHWIRTRRWAVAGPSHRPAHH